MWRKQYNELSTQEKRQFRQHVLVATGISRSSFFSYLKNSKAVRPVEERIRSMFNAFYYNKCTSIDFDNTYKINKQLIYKR